MIKRFLRSSVIFFVILGVSFSNVPFYALSELIDSYEKSSGIVDKIWLVQQNHNSDVVDNFSSLRNISGKLRVMEAMAAAPTFVNKGAFASGTGALTVGVPASYADNDVFLLFVESANEAIATPTGWTQVANSPQFTGTAASAGGVRLAVFYKVVSGAQSSVSVADTGNHTTAIIMGFRGVDTTTPVDISAGAVSAATTAMSLPAVTTTVADTFIVLAAAMDTDANSTATVTGWANGNLTGITEQHDQTVASGVGGGLAIATGVKATAGATGATTATGSTSVTHAYLTIALKPMPLVTTISNFVSAEPGNSTIAPGASGMVDSFGLATNSGTDTMTAATVGLAAGMGQYIQTVAITNDGDTVTYCSAAPSVDTASLSACGIPVSAANTQFKIKLTAKSHASMPVPPGGLYNVTATVTAFTSTNGQSGTDSGSSTLTVDNASPNGATSVSGTAGNAANTINWTTSNSADFDTTSGSVVYRWAAGAAGSETPTEGATPTLGSVNGTATVACLVSSAASAAQSKIDGSGSSADCTTTSLTNGQAYTYKAFQRDTNGNYDVGVLIGTFTPSAPAATLTISASAGSKVANIDSGATSQFVHDISCTTDGTCAAFKLSASGGAVNVTSITVTETNASLNADTDLANAALIYDTDANYSNGTAGTFGTDATFTSQAVTFTNAGLNIPNGSTYYFYIRTDLANGTARPDGGLTIDFSIANATDVVSDGTESGTATLSGTTTIRPNVTSFSNSTEPALTDGGRETHTISITGAGFGTTCNIAGGNKVSIGAYDLSCTGATFSDTSITIPVDAAIPDSNNGGTGASGLLVTIGSTADDVRQTFYVYPTIVSIDTNTGLIDKAREYSASDNHGIITVNGNHFGSPNGTNPLTILGVDTSGYGVWGDSQITSVQVPTAISDSSYTGSIVLTRNDSKNNSYSGFRILPRIMSLSSASGIIGDNITVNGDHLCQTGTCPGSPFTASNNVLFGATNADAPGTWSWSHTGINAKVPSGSGTVAVKAVSNDYDSNTTNFTYVSTAPSAPTALQQFRSNGVTEIAGGGGTNDTPTQAKMEGDFTAETSITAFLEFEVKPKNAAFDGTTNIFASSPSTGSSFLNIVVSISGLADGEYHWRARAKNQTTGETSAWVAFGNNPSGDGSGDGSPANVDFAVDTTAPVVSSVCVVSPTSSSCDGTTQTDIQAQIRWSTDENATKQVAYQTGSCGTGADATAVFNSMTSKEPSSPSGSATTHSVVLSGLTPVTTYYYKIRASDALGTVSYYPSGTTCDSFQTDPAQTRVMKTLEFFIDQNTAVGGTLNKAFDVFVSESKQDRSNIYIKSVIVDIFGTSVGDGSGNISVDVTFNGDNKIYTLSDPGSGVANSWRTTYATSSLSFDCVYCTTHPSNTLSVSVAGPTNTSLLGAKAIVTYYYEPL